MLTKPMGTDTHLINWVLERFCLSIIYVFANQLPKQEQMKIMHYQVNLLTLKVSLWLQLVVLDTMVLFGGSLVKING